MNAIKWEIRRILLGYISFSENYIIAKQSNGLRLLGIFNGTSEARIFGIAQRTRCYRVSEINKPLAHICDNAFANMGRRIQLESAPDRLAVLFSPFWYNPSVLTAELLEDDKVEICVYSARTISVGLNARHAFHCWKKNMPETLEDISINNKQHKTHRTGADDSKKSEKKTSVINRIKEHLSHKDEDEE